jgi:alcohol dehydrogenase
VNGLRPRGRHVQVGLLFGTDSTPPLPMDRIVAHELEIYGSHGMAACAYPPLLELIASGAVHPERLVNTVIGLDDAGAALAAMSEPMMSAGITVVRV